MKHQALGHLSLKKVISSTFLLTALLSFVAALSLPVQSAYAAGTITVDRTDDTAAASACTGAANDCSLRGAVIFANANPGTTINVPAGTYNLTLDGNTEGGNCTSANIGDLDIAGNNTSIVGAGAATTIINQTMPNDRVICVDQFLVGNFTFSISGVTISGGRETHGVGGGGIISGGTNDVTNVTNVIFSNNQTSGSGSPVGGGIGNGAGTLNVTGSTFDTNQSQGSGGGIYYSANGGAGSFTLTNSTFTNNVTTGGDGGALKTTSTATPYTISNSTFTGNKAQGTTATGGAVVNESGTLNIDHSTFVNNQVTASGGRGGAIGSSDGAGHNVAVTFSRFVGNTAATAANGNVLYGGSSSTMTANDNWWGVNTGPAVNDRAGTTTVSNYLTMINTASPNPILVNQTTTLTASFLKDSANNSIATSDLAVLIGQPVTWGSAVRGTLSSPQTTIQANGTATATFTANAAGAGSAGATVDNGTGTASITINKANTATSVTSDTPDPSVTGQSVTVNFSVSSSTGSSPTAPSGNVTVSDGVDSCTGTVASGSCSLALSTAGNRTLTATYAGDPNFNGSTSTAEAHQVNKANTTTTITSDTPDPSVVGQAITVNYAVTVNSPGSGTPTGNVTVSDGTVSCTGTVAAGQCSLTFTSAGAKSLTAAYAGDSNFNGSTSGAESHTVNQADTTTTITSDNPDPSAVGQAVAVNFTVTANSPGSGTPTGNVTVSDGVDSCTGTVASGTCNITLTTQGARTLTATYAGDSNFNGSTSAGEPHTVNGVGTITTIMSDNPDPSAVGQSVTVQFSVAPTVGSGTPTGNVTVSDGVNSCTATVAAGTCSITLTTQGARTLTATYAGDSNFNGSTSAGEAHIVNQKATPTITWANPADITYGTPLGATQLNATASVPGSFVYTPAAGTVLNAGAGQTLHVDFTPTDTANYNTASADVTINVLKAPLTITADNKSKVYGSANPILTASYSGFVNGDTPASLDTSVSLSTTATTASPVGTYPITASGAADANYTITFVNGTLTVTKANTTTTITSDNPDPSAGGQSITVNYQVTVNAPGAGTPTGNVTVSDGVNSCVGTAAAGTCNITLTTNGARTLTATYSGDSNFNGSVSAGEPHTVNAPNLPPTASVTNGQCSAVNLASGTIDLTLFDPNGDTLTLALASNSNITLVPNSNIAFGGSGNNRTLTVTAAANKSGTATLTLNLSDGHVTTPVVITVKVGTSKSEVLNGTSGIDMIFGLGGANAIIGYGSNDLLCGGNSSDAISGGDGNDIIDGQGGTDLLSGDKGNDILRGGPGNDALIGGAGADAFSGGSGIDTAVDFNAAQGDTKDGTIP